MRVTMTANETLFRKSKFPSSTKNLLFWQQQRTERDFHSSVHRRSGQVVSADEIGRIDSWEAGAGNRTRCWSPARVIIVRPIAIFEKKRNENGKEMKNKKVGIISEEND